jgi:hypothetical protein
MSEMAKSLRGMKRSSVTVYNCITFFLSATQIYTHNTQPWPLTFCSKVKVTTQNYTKHTAIQHKGQGDQGTTQIYTQNTQQTFIAFHVIKYNTVELTATDG